MTLEDAPRKDLAPSRIKTDNRAMAAEVEIAFRLQKAPTERYAIKAEDIPDASPRTRVFQLTWSGADHREG